MIVFNCSQAFAEFIEPKHAGPAPLIGEAPSPHPSQDAPFLIDADGEPPRHLQQWLVHFVRIQRKPCAVAMDIDTRYAMVFSHLKKGDPEGFLNAFATGDSRANCDGSTAAPLLNIADFLCFQQKFAAGCP